MSALLFYLVMSGYSILRPIREDMGIAGGVDALHNLFLVTLTVTALAAPAVGWLVRRYRREVFLPVALRFFAANLVLFFLALRFADGELLVWSGRVFYVWLSVFNLAVLSLFWSFMVDGFGYERSRRLFGMIAVAGTLGAVSGAGLTTLLVHHVGRAALFLVSIVLFEAASRCVGPLSRRFAPEPVPVADRTGRADSGVLAGITRTVRSPYLLGISGYVLLYTLLGTLFYFAQAHIVDDNVVDREARTALFAKIDFWAQGCTLVIQLLLTGRLMKSLGSGPLLAWLPLVYAAGFAILAWQPTVAVLVVVQVVRRSSNYGLAKPARETLFTVVAREDRYKAKNFIDTFVYRGGDAVGSLVSAALASITWLALPLTAVWGALAVVLGRRQRARATSGSASRERREG